MANSRGRRFQIDDEELPQKLNQSIINELQEEILANDPTEFVPADIRNVLFCGASRSGKSTVFHILQNSCYCPSKITMFAETKYTSFRTFSLRDRLEGTVHNFVVNLIDTPGTFEVRATKDEFETRSNEEISDLIIDCINHEVTYLNLLVLVLNSNRFSETEMDSVDIFLKLFGKTTIPIILCLTHADALGKERRSEIEKELQEHPRLSQYFSEKIFTILWMGCVNHVQRDYTDAKTMSRDYKLVANWRDNFMDKIFSSGKRVSLEETDIYLNRKLTTFDTLNKVLVEIPKFLDLNYEELVGGAHLKLLHHTKDMNHLFAHSFYLEKERDNKQYMDLYHQFHALVNTVKSKSDIKDEFKQQLLGSWY